MLLYWLLGLLSLGSVSAQQPQRPSELDRAAIEAQRNAAKDLQQLSEADRAAIVDSYTKALASLQAADASAEKARGLQAGRAAVPDRLRDAQAELAKPPQDVVPVAPDDASLADLRTSATAAEDEARRAAEDLAAVEARIKTRSTRQPALPELIAAARARVAQLTEELDGVPVVDPMPETAAARRTELLAERFAAQLDVAALEAEAASYDGNEQLLTAERDLARRRVAQADRRVKAWQRLVQARRVADAKQDERSAAADVARTENRHPLLESMAKENEALAKQRTALADRLTATSDSILASGSRLKDLKQDLEDVSKRVVAIGLTDGMGALLRDRRSSLPNPRNIRRRIDDTRAKRTELQQDRFKLDDLRSALRDPAFLSDLLAAAIPPLRDDVANVEKVARELLGVRLELVDQLIADSGTLFDSLVRLESAEQKLLAQTSEYAEFVNERVLWIRSTSPLWQPKLRDLREGLAWLLQPANWGGVLAAIWQGVRNSPLLTALGALLWFVLLGSQRRARRGIGTLAEAASRGSNVQFAPTFYVILLSLLTALPIPATLWLCGRLIESGVTAVDLARPFGQAVTTLAGFVLVLEFVRQCLRPRGLAEAHFGWAAHPVRQMRRGLLLLLPISAVVLLLVLIFENHGNLGWKEAIGQPALMIALAVLARFCWRMLHPRKGLGVIRDGQADGLSARTKTTWFLLGVGVPVALFLLALLGYYFTTVQLLLRLGVTLGVLSALVFVHEVSLRRFLIARRRLAIQQAMERRKAAAAQREAGATEVPDEKPIEEALVDVRSVAEQTRSLLRYLVVLSGLVAFWLIWVDVLPALGIFDAVPLAEGVTLADALLATIVFVMTFVAARNIPGVLQLTILQRLQVHEGERHAITTIARYAIILIGVLYGFATLGLGWGKLQWLAAGVSVGLGFGLQEIFANFISGLIILFERPVRVGDLVTVGGVDGYVTRIKMRATTIRDYNRKELVIPNKEFITGSIVNWTLSDSTTRLILSVGVAYGSDTARARDILLAVAAEDGNVLDKPKPKALFMGFGDSTLNFQLRVFTANVDVWPEVIDGLNRRIDDEFRAAGIEIAFPQRDLHIRSAAPLVELMTRQQAAERAANDEAEPPSVDERVDARGKGERADDRSGD